MLKKTLIASAITATCFNAVNIAHVHNYKIETSYDYLNEKHLVLTGEKSKNGGDGAISPVTKKKGNLGGSCAADELCDANGNTKVKIYDNDDKNKGMVDLLDKSGKDGKAAVSSKPYKDTIKPKTKQAATLVAKLDYYRDSCFVKKCVHGTEKSDMVAWFNAGISAALAHDDRINKAANAFLTKEAYVQSRSVKAKLPKEYYDIEFKKTLSYQTLKNGNVEVKGVFAIKSSTEVKNITVSSELKKIKGKYGFIQDIAIINVK